MASGLGTSFSVTVVLNDHIFDANDVEELSMTIPINELPFGSATVLVTNQPDFQLDSGCFGRFVFLNTGYTGVDGTGFMFLITSASQSLVNEGTVAVKFNWKMNSPELMKKTTNAIKGSSLDAMQDILKEYEGIMPYTNLIVGDAANLTDTMTWRYVNCNLVDKMRTTVDHSAMVGDYMFWTYDIVSQSIVISSLNTSKKVSTPMACIYSQDARTSTASTRFVDSNTNSEAWLYYQEERMTNKGDNLAETFPNIVSSSVDSKGKADVSNCYGDCYDALMQHYGAMNAKQTAEKFSLPDTKSVYGDLKVINNFPGNVHKSYCIAEQIRLRHLTEYSKLVAIGLTNCIGPAVGSRVYVYSLKPAKNGGVEGPDMYYTDEYIVVAKRIKKDSTVSSGALGSAHFNQQPDHLTILTLVSNSEGIDGYDPTMKKLDEIAKACKVEADKMKK